MVRNIKRLLVANRGEIAIRVFRAASEMQISTVAMYTYEDRYSLHRYKADEAYQIGNNDEPLKPYLDIEAIISLAKRENIDAIHPGYGLLSENSDFAQRCVDEGLIWVGPSAEVMLNLGNKLKAKKIAKKVKVPTVPAIQESIKDEKDLEDKANQLGFPIMIKATTGGGGRGMRIVKNKAALKNAYQEATNEAKTAFGNSEVFIEKFIEDPKHIEVQILGDHHGQLIHLFERDCSVQRRHQKVCEIAPALYLKNETKQKLHDYSVRLGKEVDYQNAGTVEFLVDKDENIYFIEVNTRIQVEHTVTEVVTGVDLIKCQLLIADGYSLFDPTLGIHSKDHLSIRGVAIQCRITTEDPYEGFKPDFGRLVAYRSASGFGIRLDAGNAYAGARISPFFDSMLVKVTASGNSLAEAADRLHRTLREFRIRGVKSNIPFLLNLLKNENFRNGNTSVNFIAQNPQLISKKHGWKDRGTKLLNYLGDVIVNQRNDMDLPEELPEFQKPVVPNYSDFKPKKGTKDLLNELGRDKFIRSIQANNSIYYTDTTFRDAHQSLLATRFRTYDLYQVAQSYATRHGHDLFSIEMWGGATFDVSMRFLKECPWQRLKLIRDAFPNTLLQMLIRGSNAVGYKAYPDNLIEKFVIASWKNGIDVFRIFDSLNWPTSLETTVNTIIKNTDALAEVAICYTGDILKKGQNKYNLQYYIDLARKMEDMGAHILCIKDMAGLLKPKAAEILINGLKENINLPIHLHTHDTSSIQSATYLSAVDSGVDIIDVAISSMSGLTSQPNFNSVVAMLEGHERSSSLDLDSLNKYALYWENVRKYYFPFETELKAGTAEVYEHEIPGGQYSNLKPQARSLGLEDQFEQLKKNYKAVNDLLGGLTKVTPSSKVIGDMAMFMCSNDYTIDDLREKGDQIAFPDSMVALMKGELGQRPEGWPLDFQKAVLKGQNPIKGKSNAHLMSIDFEEALAKFKKNYPHYGAEEELLSSLLYPKVYDSYYQHQMNYGNTSVLPTPAFFYGLEFNEEIEVDIAKGKTILIQYLNTNAPRKSGNRLVIFRLNGSIRSIIVDDKNFSGSSNENQKASSEFHIGSPLQGSLSKILVKEGDVVIINDPLFIIEAMKMESTITAFQNMRVKKIYLKEKSLVMQNDLILEWEEI